MLYANSPPQIVATLKAKRHDIEASVKAYDAKLQQARRDLAHVQATLALFATDDPGTIRAYTDTSRLFNRGEVWTLCCAALAERGPMDTRGAVSMGCDIEGHGRRRPCPVQGPGLPHRPVHDASVEAQADRVGGGSGRGCGYGRC